MIDPSLLELAKNKSAIREAMAYAKKRGKEIGYENVFDFSLGNPSVPPPASYNKALVQLIETEPAIKLHGYGDAKGIFEVRKAVAESLNSRYQAGLTESHIFIAPGASSALQHAIRAVTTYGQGDEVLFFAPYFPEYHAYVRGAGCVPKIVPPDIHSFQINWSAFASAINENTRVVLINSPNNPTGVVYSEETLMHLSSILVEKQREFGTDIYLISDEPYREIVFEGVAVPYVPQFYKNTLIAYSFSKSLSIPGERLGYVVIHPESADAEQLQDVMVAISRLIGYNGSSTLIQRSLLPCINTLADLSVYETNKNLLFPALLKAGFTVVEPGGTFYLFPRTPEPDATAFCARARKYDLILVPGDSFGCPSHFRLAYCVPTEKLMRSLPLFSQLMAEYHLK